MITVFYKSDKLTLDQFANELKNAYLINYHHCKKEELRLPSKDIMGSCEFVKTSGGTYLVESAGGSLYLNETRDNDIHNKRDELPLITNVLLQADLSCCEYFVHQILTMRIEFGEFYTIHKYRRDYEDFPFFNIWRLTHQRNDSAAASVLIGDRYDRYEIVELQLND